tara:strand:+ start:317 stop:673 length:357 start_codon:yes stop_codon:yes gene_type:complete
VTKEQLTEIFMRELDLNPALYKKYLWAWWQNPISKTSLRLTKSGHDCLVNFVKLESHSVRVKSEQLGKNLKIFLLLDKLITTPFYIPRRDTIVFFGERDLIMLQLMGGDLDQYLDNLS